jgi:hypothetical protein
MLIYLLECDTREYAFNYIIIVGSSEKYRHMRVQYLDLSSYYIGLLLNKSAMSWVRTFNKATSVIVGLAKVAPQQAGVRPFLYHPECAPEWGSPILPLMFGEIEFAIGPRKRLDRVRVVEEIGEGC